MADQLRNMEFEVKNLGVVKQGKFTQQPLTILCGPNNNSKTWVMYALYYFHKRIWGLGKGKAPDLLDNMSRNLLPDLNNEDLAYLFNTSKELLKNAQFISKLSEEQFTHRVKNRANTFLMPAERTGLHLFYRELGTRRTALLHHASREKINLQELLRDVIHFRYAIPIADYINWLNQLPDNQRGGPNDFHSYAQYLKKKLVQGSYTVNRSAGDITFKPYQLKRDGNPTQSMGLHMTSSTVKSLFGLWFYLEYQAQPGDLLMIDEPELNLHPESQRKVARLLAKLVNAGLNLVISTHSDYIIRELNSLIMLKNEHAQNLQKKYTYTENGKKYTYEEDETLDMKMVGAYLLDNQTITPSEISPNDGIYAITFDEAIRNLNQDNDNIYYSLQEISYE